MEEDIRKVLASNVLALLVDRGGALGPKERKGYSRLVNKGIPMGTAQRVLDGKTSIGIDKVQEVAALFGAEAWQLLVPGMDAKALPKLLGDRSSADGSALSKEVESALREADPEKRWKAENTLRVQLDIDPLPRPSSAHDHSRSLANPRTGTAG